MPSMWDRTPRPSDWLEVVAKAMLLTGVALMVFGGGTFLLIDAFSSGTRSPEWIPASGFLLVVISMVLAGICGLIDQFGRRR